MASDRSSPPRRTRTPPGRPIPLQNLTRPPDTRGRYEDNGGHARTLSGRAGALLGHRQSFSGARINTAYERVRDGSPPSPDTHHPYLPRITTPRSTHQAPPDPYEDGEVSPVGMEFQAAIGSVGLSFEHPEPLGPSRPALPHAASSSRTRRGTLGMVHEWDSTTSLPDSSRQPTNEDDGENYYPPTDDRTPLTDSRAMGSISGAHQLRVPGQGHDRSGSRLGDDLPNTEAGLRPVSTHSQRSLSRSLSVSGASSPLSRAGTMMRKMSQRVVNLSNEPDPVEQSIRRQPSMHSTRSAEEARMDEPPSLPAMTDFAHDERQRSTSPREKLPRAFTDPILKERPRDPNPLKGNSLGLFAPDNWIRLRLCELLVHPVTEPVILVLIVIQTILLAIDSASKLDYEAHIKNWSSSWLNYALLILFCIYTLEIIIRIIVSGFIKNAVEYSTLDFDLSFRQAVKYQFRNFFKPNRHVPTGKVANPVGPEISILQSITRTHTEGDKPGNSRQQQRIRLARRAFFRHSFNRLDFLAVLSFWIHFILLLLGVEYKRHIFLFRMLSCLRILRLLGITSGTSVILRSLKKAAPLLVNVAFLIGFFWLLFAIVGTQVFKNSFRRSCVWFQDFEENGDPVRQNLSFTWNDAPETFQACGGYLNATTGAAWPWRHGDADLTNGTDVHKGYLCPQRSMCIEGTNPYNGTVSFDNVLQSLQLVFVIMSSNTFSDLLYYTTDSDFLPAALFFAVGIVIMSLWLMNLLVAVITSSFQVIREESKSASAFAADEQLVALEDDEKPKKLSSLKRFHDKTYWVWITVIVFDLVVQCLRSAQMGAGREAFINNTETVITLVLVFEICFRFASDWRNFHRSKRNWVDLGLAVVTAVIQFPPIRSSGQPYAWLTFFQIVRFYRVVLAVSLTRDLIMVVLGNVTGLLNLIVFVFLITFLCAIFAVQIFRGEFPSQDMGGNDVHITFADIYNSFIGMYQVLSSENWTILMYNAAQYDLEWSTGWIGAAFFILWFILANFIVLNMFIAVIQENFDVSEDEKRLQQVKAFLQQKDLGGSSQGTLSLSAIFRLGRGSKRHRDPLDYGPASMEMLFKDTVVRDFLDERLESVDEIRPESINVDDITRNQVQTGLLSLLWGKLVGILHDREPNPFYSRLQFSKAREELDPRTMAHEVVSAAEQRKRAQRLYLRKHPTYNVSLYLFTPSNPIRRLCQRIVGPGRGSQRIEGVEPVKVVWYIFSALIYAAIVAMVLLACVATPLYQREYFQQHGYSVRNWFVWTDMGFAVVFTIEAIIKVIADGFFWTPNAYFRGSWGLIDGLVLITLWINIATSLYKDGAVSRAVGAFKALRALRLLNVSDSARDTFHSVIVLGGWKVLSAAFVSLSLLFPFAIYGLNLFNGRFKECNDTSFPSRHNLTDCVGEYNNSISNWEVLAPRRVANLYYNFDEFGSSLFILFQIVSQEGWTDVMWQAMQAAGPGLQPDAYFAQGNAIFFIIFNLLGAVFVLTLFVSVFMRNYTEQTGIAYLTAEQRSWLELRKLLKQISPSKRPTHRQDQNWRAWCYRLAVTKNGKWHRFLTFLLFFHLVLLILEFSPEIEWWEITRDWIFLALTVFYVVNIGVRVVGLTWKRFRSSSWDCYSVLSITGTVITTLLNLSRYHNHIYRQLHKLFLVSIALLLIPRNNQLDQLFKTAAASLTAIGNLLATWFVLFLVFAIALTQTFGLTRFGGQETGNLNFRNVPKALILLFRMSCGEGWNNIMEDFATITPPNCVVDKDFYNSDCGSTAWARALFISWNIVSMYIFVSLFVSLIFESFSYVYQRSSGSSTVGRDETRRFKQAWATFDPDGIGYISTKAFPRLLGELSGVFDMRIYSDENSVHRILDDCTVDPRGLEQNPPGVVGGVDIARLNERLQSINVREIRQRRKRMEMFYQEVMVSADPAKGISFTQCLLTLAHYKVITDSLSLRLEEYLRRRARLQRVEEEVRRNVVTGWFDMMHWSQWFRSRRDSRASAIMNEVPQFAVPEIFIDDENATSPQAATFPDMPPQVPPKESSPFQTQNTTGGRHSSEAGRSPSRSDRSLNVSPINSPGNVSPSASHRPSPSQSSSFNWGYDGNSDDAFTGGRSRAGSSVNRQEVLEVFDNSAWGESIRRSFTTRRSGTRPRGER